jgi:hypothetical protein
VNQMSDVDVDIEDQIEEIVVTRDWQGPDWWFSTPDEIEAHHEAVLADREARFAAHGLPNGDRPDAAPQADVSEPPLDEETVIEPSPEPEPIVEETDEADQAEESPEED